MKGLRNPMTEIMASTTAEKKFVGIPQYIKLKIIKVFRYHTNEDMASTMMERKVGEWEG